MEPDKKSKSKKTIAPVNPRKAVENIADTIPPAEKLFQDIATMIERSRHKVVAKINSEMVELYWHIGKRIKQDLLKNKKAEYGKQVIESLAKKLMATYGKGFNVRNLFHMLNFIEVFPNDNILQTVSAKLSWSHLIELIYLKDDLKKFAGRTDSLRRQIKRSHRITEAGRRSNQCGGILDQTSSSRNAGTALPSSDPRGQNPVGRI